MSATIQEQVQALFLQQTNDWPLARKNFDDLHHVQTKSFNADGNEVLVQFNPARMVSSGAKVDAKTIANRKCFLCATHRPAEQKGILWGDYTILINPFPIFPQHFTIPRNEHVPQQIKPYFADMLALAKDMEKWLVFYNGPHCGASAPDHMHFQAGTKDFLPLINRLQNNYFAGKISSPNFPTVLQIHTDSTEEVQKQFVELYDQLACGKEEEPMMNMVCSYEKAQWHIYILPRKAFRPWQYTAEGNRQLLISPATVEMCGMFITPVKEHFDRITTADICDIYRQTSSYRPKGCLFVGIMAVPTLQFQLSGKFYCLQNGEFFEGKQICSVQNGLLEWNGKTWSEILLEPQDESENFFELEKVTIGIGFHWERQENERFRGALKLMVENNCVRAINQIQVENYLESVISSEMSATSSLELLKAHAVISRSWVLAPLVNTSTPDKNTEVGIEDAETSTHIKWYERDAHTHFDVCADDHCQRYQGITRATTEFVKQAVEATRGEVLVYNGAICDARFSKSCGGVSELFENCWDEKHHDYLIPIRDTANATEEIPDLTNETNAEKWIRNTPASFCDTNDQHILQQVLNHYDQETADFYRWKVRYTQNELSLLIQKRSGIDFGNIIDLIPIQRGVSGRLIQLKIIGSKRTMIIGKELEIRRWLSESHLYSSAFIVEKDKDNTFTLIGAGWGHGVGLCQIGAAVMAAKGYNYRQILQHYFRGAKIEKR